MSNRPVLVLIGLLSLGCTQARSRASVTAGEGLDTGPASARTPAQAPELRFPRTPALSPDGSRVAFGHQGDVWVAPVDGGQAVRLTAHDAYDGRPKWSPDGTELAFASNRHGNYDVFLMKASGGLAERITWNSESERLHGWLDGDRVLIGATRERRYSRRGRGAWVAYRDARTPTILGDWPMRNPSVSPNGRWIAYERGHGDPSRRGYRGSASSALWLYDTQSDSHIELTVFEGNDLEPMWSGDGSTLYFLSDRACDGNESGRDLGLWMIRRTGGEPELVYHPGGRSLRFPEISADGAFVIAELDAGMVRIDTATGRARPVPVYGSIDTSMPDVVDTTISKGASQLAVSPDGESIAFIARGDLYVMRKHDEIHRAVRVTEHAAPESEPVWVDEGKALLFVSAREGNGEVYRVRPEEEETPFYKARGFSVERLTETAFDESSLGLSPDGETLAWVQGNGRFVIGDPETLEVRRTLAEGFDAPDYDWSPDSAWLCYSMSDNDFNNEVYLQRVEIDGLDPSAPGVGPFNVTRHPDDDTGPRWSPDGRAIAFTSRRRMLDETDVWMVWLDRQDAEMTEQERLEAEEAKAKAKKKKGKKQDEPEEEEEAPGGEDPISGIWTCTLEGPEEMLPGGTAELTLDLTLQEDDSISGTATIPIGTAELSGTFDPSTGEIVATATDPDGVKYRIEASVEGEKIEGRASAPGLPVGLRFSGERTEKRVPASEADEQEGEDEDEDEKPEVEPVVIDFERLPLRLEQKTRREGNESFLGWSSDSETLYYNATVGTRLTSGTRAENGFFSIGVHEDEPEKVEGSTVSSFTRHDKELLYVRGGGIVGHSGKSTSYPFSVTFRDDRRALAEEVLEQAWRVLDRWFYDPNHHGHDWAASLAKWKPIALDASTPEDFGLAANWMLGEMNASHMGYFGGPSSKPSEVDSTQTGHLGVVWDDTHQGEGRKIARVLVGSPAAREVSRLEPGEVILAVNGRGYSGGDNWSRLMAGTVGEETWLDVLGTDGEKREVRIRPASSGGLGNALYEQSVEDARKAVEEGSNGRLGYIHIQGMGTGSLLEFERDLFRAGHQKEGLLIDVRENGGGWTTDMILAMLMVEDHAITIPRGGGEGYPQGRRIFASWDAPVVVLCNENSYSNAEIFSWAIKTLGRGPVVGKETYGAVISTGGQRLLNGAFVRMPFRGWYVNDDAMTNMEGNGCPPDHPVENRPGDIQAGVDRQLEKAVEVGLAQLEDA